MSASLRTQTVLHCLIIQVLMILSFVWCNFVDNFPVCAHAVLGSPEILRGLSPILGAICSPRNISGEPSTTWAHTGKLSTVLLKLKLWDSQPLAAKPTAKYHISIVFSIKLLLKLIWLKVSSVFNLGQRQQWNFPSLSCGA